MRVVTAMMCLLLAGAGVSQAAQARPYFGTWRVNSAKSDFKGVTATYKDLGGGRIEVSGMGQKEVFVIARDGKEYPWISGTTITWRDTGPNRSEIIVWQNGQLIVSMDSTLSTDGNTITNVLESTPPGAKAPVETTTKLSRVSGGPGIFGTWRMAEVQGGLHLEAAGDAILFRWIDYAQAHCRFDGHDCPLDGPVPTGSTMTLRETGPRSFEYQDKTKGMVNYTSRFTVSDDGKTLSEEQTMPTGEKWHIVYDREK